MIGPGVPENRVVVEQRSKLYEKRIRYGRAKGEVELIEGWEIVKEIVVGPDAYRELTGLEPAQNSKSSLLAKDIRPIENTRPARRKKKWTNPNQKKSSRSSQQKTRSNKSKTGPVVEKVNLPTSVT
jgi:hypothetical protein